MKAPLANPRGPPPKAKIWRDARRARERKSILASARATLRVENLRTLPGSPGSPTSPWESRGFPRAPQDSRGCPRAPGEVGDSGGDLGSSRQGDAVVGRGRTPKARPRVLVCFLPYCFLAAFPLLYLWMASEAPGRAPLPSVSKPPPAAANSRASRSKLNPSIAAPRPEINPPAAAPRSRLHPLAAASRLEINPSIAARSLEAKSIDSSASRSEIS